MGNSRDEVQEAAIIKQIINNDFTEARKIAAETVLKMLIAGNLTITKWVMDKTSGEFDLSNWKTGETFGRDKGVSDKSNEDD